MAKNSRQNLLHATSLSGHPIGQAHANSSKVGNAQVVPAWLVFRGKFIFVATEWFDVETGNRFSMRFRIGRLKALSVPKAHSECAFTLPNGGGTRSDWLFKWNKMTAAELWSQPNRLAM